MRKYIHVFSSMSLVGYIRVHLTNLVNTEKICNTNLSELASHIPDIVLGSRAEKTYSTSESL